MLCISRKVLDDNDHRTGESIVLEVEGEIIGEIKVLYRGGTGMVRVALELPKHIKILRSEHVDPATVEAFRKEHQRRTANRKTQETPR